MKRVTKNNLLKLVAKMKEYQKTQDKQLFIEINNFIDKIINKDKKYYAKLSSYNFPNDIIVYLI